MGTAGRWEMPAADETGVPLTDPRRRGLTRPSTQVGQEAQGMGGDVHRGFMVVPRGRNG